MSYANILIKPLISEKATKAVGQFYADFPQVDDREVEAILGQN